MITASDAHCLVICSTDGKLMCRLIDWLNEAVVEKESTLIRVHEMDPQEEIDLLRAQIEGMSIRIHDAERAVQGQGNS